MRNAGKNLTTYPLERWLAILGAAVCLIITIVIFWIVSAYQSMWLLPGLYFIEIAVVSLICAYMVLREDPRRMTINWVVTGIFIAFSILTGFSVGIYYMPVALIFAILSVVSDVRNKQPIAAHLGICLIGGIAQAALMLLVVQLHNPGAVF
jgi:hypothetical protein